MRKILAGLLSSMLLFSVSIKAQELVPLTLEEAIAATLKSNKEISMAGFDEQSAHARVRQTDAVFLPHINLSYSGMSTNNPLHAFGFKLQQQGIEQSDFDPTLLNDPSATQNFTTKAEWQQPILNMDMLYMRKAAQQESEVYLYKTRRTKEYLTFETTKAYAQLQLAHQAKQVLEVAMETINAIYKETNDRYEKGFLQKSDVLQVEVQVYGAKSRLAEATSNVQNASDYLSLLMGAESGTIYTVGMVGAGTYAESIEIALPDNRADFQAIQAAISAQDKMISAHKMSLVPSLNAFAQYLINDKEAFGFRSDSYLVGAQLSWSLFNGMSVQNKAAEARIQRDKMTTELAYRKSQSQLELDKTLRQLQDANYALEQNAVAVRQAQEALRILQNRYQQGLVTTNDLLQAQSMVSQQQLQQAQTYFQVNTTHAYLQFLTTTSEK